MNRSAIISPDGRFRYLLTRDWDIGPVFTFVMLNPSTADSEQDDPTIRRCIGFAQRHGAAGLEVVNLYAFRATKPISLKSAGYLIGPDNDTYIVASARRAIDSGGKVICAWGTNARGHVRAAQVFTMLRVKAKAELYALAVTPDNVPRHPLMLRNDSRLVTL